MSGAGSSGGVVTGPPHVAAQALSLGDGYAKWYALPSCAESVVHGFAATRPYLSGCRSASHRDGAPRRGV